MIEIKAAPGISVWRETHMDPLTSAGLVVVLIVAIVVGYYIMKPEKPQKN